MIEIRNFFFSIAQLIGNLHMYCQTDSCDRLQLFHAWRASGAFILPRNTQRRTRSRSHGSRFWGVLGTTLCTLLLCCLKQSFKHLPVCSSALFYPCFLPSLILWFPQTLPNKVRMVNNIYYLFIIIFIIYYIIFIIIFIYYLLQPKWGCKPHLGYNRSGETNIHIKTLSSPYTNN